METSALKPMMRSYYDILGVANTASMEEINEAYEKLAYGQKEADDKDMAAYHEATKAYQTLIDPNKRRQYDITGEIEEGEEYDGLDVKSLGGIGRMFGAMISRLGVPLQTTISQDTLNIAAEICNNGSLLGGGSCLDERVEDLVWGWSMNGRVERQTAKFYRITVDQQHVDNGFIIFCRSLSGKFKLVLFDAKGSVLHIEESQKSRDKSQTESALYFTHSFDMYHLGAPIPNVVREQDIPPVFSALSSFSKCNLSIASGQYLLCVYGDNFIGRTNFNILAVPTSNSCEEAREVQSLDAAVLEKKEELGNFQAEYLEAREKFEQATRRLKKEEAVVDDLVDRREFAYSSFLVASADAFLPSATPQDYLEESRHQNSSVIESSSATLKSIIPSGETLASMTSTATSTASAASGWMSSRLSLGLNKLMTVSGAAHSTETVDEKSVFENVDVIHMDKADDEENNETSFSDTVENSTDSGEQLNERVSSQRDSLSTEEYKIANDEVDDKEVSCDGDESTFRNCNTEDDTANVSTDMTEHNDVNG